MTKKDKVTVDDIIGIVHTDEPTDSVEEVRKLRGRENKTEKRFTTDNGSHEDVCLVDNLTKKEYESNFEDMVSLMNDIWNQTQRFEKHNQRLEKENEQLKSTINTLTHNNTKMKKVLNTTKKENEQIKHHIKEAYHNERTHIGKSVLKQLIEAIQ